MKEGEVRTPTICPDFIGTWGKKGICRAISRSDRQFGCHHNRECLPGDQISFTNYHQASPTEGLTNPGIMLLRPVSNTNTSQYKNEVTKTRCPRVDRRIALQERKLNNYSTAHFKTLK